MNFFPTPPCCLNAVSTDPILKSHLQDHTSIEYLEEEIDKTRLSLHRERKFSGLIKLLKTKTGESITGLFKEGAPFGEFTYISPQAIYKGRIKSKLLYFESIDQAIPSEIDPLKKLWIDKIKNFKIVLHGHGILELRNMILTGTFDEGEPIGEFHIKFIDETKDLSEYRGGVNASHELHGKGCLTLKDGSTYNGNFEHNEMKGRFTIKFKTDPLFVSYNGEMDKGGFGGGGKLVLREGRIISADFENGLPKSSAIVEDSVNNTKYQGYLDANLKKTGFGHLYKLDGTDFYGEFLNDKPIGRFFINDSTRLTTYKGLIDIHYRKQGPFYIEKTIVTENRTYRIAITGAYFNDMPSGLFTIISEEFVYTGEVDSLLNPSGNGKIVDNFGITLIGYFNDGLPVKGKILYRADSCVESVLEIEDQLSLFNEYLRIRELGPVKSEEVR